VRLLDLYCGAGGAAEGYRRAGFDQIVGVDIKKKRTYPFELVVQDALDYLDELIRSGHDFDAVHASPPCQRYSAMTNRWNPASHPDLVGPTRDRLQKLGIPYIIENVVGAPLLNPTMLCGTMFGLGVWRHRLFESPDQIFAPGPCAHTGSPVGVYGHSGGSGSRRSDERPLQSEWNEAMGIDWMSTRDLAGAIPPAYTEWIGRHLVARIVERRSNDRSSAA
jgi:DNA (cytosine-5)-methyltransferase 1